MNRPTKKFIAFSTALVSMIGLMAPMSASAAYEAELMEKCEYDELIEMRDKAILIKDGNDYTVNDATQLVVIDSNGEKKLISKEEGLNSIYNYVTTTRGLYNFISPTNDPYSFDFFDENYRISTESGVIIAGFNDKFALMDADGKKLSAEYDAIYRISDDYFMVDVINGDKRSTGLIKSDGSVIAAPAEGVGEFYLCGNKFLVSDYKTEIIERENWLGEIVQEEQVVYTYRFMSLDGKTENETFIGFTELGHNYNIPSFDASDRDHFSSDLRYEVDYAFENDCIALTYADDKQVIYNSKTETFSDKYDSVQGISADKFVVSTDGVYAVVDTEYKALIDGAENMTFYKTLQVKKDGKVTEYDTELNVIEELNIEKIFPTFENPTIETNGNIVTVNSDESYWGYPTIDTEYVSTSVNVEITPVWKNSDVEVSLYEDYTSDFDFQLDVFEEYYDESAGYTVTTSNRYKYVLDSLYQPHDVSEYARVSENINHDVVVLQKEDGYLDYVNFADAKDKKDLSAYKYLTPVDNHILGNAYYSEREQIGYCLKTDDSFAVSDMNFNLLTEPVEGTPSAVKISCKDNVYSGAVEFYVNSGTGSNSVNKYGVMSLEKGVVIPAVYDSVSVGYGGYLVTQNGQTTVMNENGEAVKEFDGAYSFNSITGCVYDADWNLVKRDNDVTSTIVYNIENDEIKYQQTGKYDEVSYFVDGYAQVVKYAENTESDDLWSGEEYDNFYGIIDINGTEVVKPVDNLYITMNADFTEGDTSFRISADSKTEGKDRSNITLSVKELAEGYINANNMTVAKKTGENSYLALVNGLWGVYDGEGKEIIKPQFDLFNDFTEDGLSIVETPESNTCYVRSIYGQEYKQNEIYKTGVIDIDGNVIVEPYNNIPEDGVKVQSTRSSYTPYALKTVLMDDYGIHMCKLVNGKPKYMTITPDDVLNDFAKTNGYDSAHKQGSLYFVEKDGLSGVVSENNDVIIPVEYFEILSYRPSDINLTYVNPELHDILKDEFSSKTNAVSETCQLVYVKTTDGKVGVYKLTGADNPAGDANGDGKVTVRDAAAIAAALAKKKEDTLPASADFNGDGKVTVRDAAAIAAALAKGKL